MYTLPNYPPTKPCTARPPPNPEERPITEIHFVQNMIAALWKTPSHIGIALLIRPDASAGYPSILSPVSKSFSILAKKLVALLFSGLGGTAAAEERCRPTDNLVFCQYTVCSLEK